MDMGIQSHTSQVVEYWPTLLVQWFITGSIMNMIRIMQWRSLKDQKNGWRATHAAAALRSPNADEIFQQVFNGIEKTSCLTLFSAKDRDGDTPLHSVVKTGVQALPRLTFLLDRLPLKLLRSTLEMTNKLGQTPLKVAFDQQEWKMLERLFECCIQNGLCSNLTGIGNKLHGTKTLLHRAMDKGWTRFVKIYFDITARNLKYGKPDLLVCDKKGRTPWHYLMNHKDPKILRKILCTLKKHNIDVNELTTDKHSGSTMLHLAYRKNHQECIQLLKKAGADPGKKDTRDLKAYQRDHRIGGSQEEQTALDQQLHIRPVESSDESQQERSSDEEAVEEEMPLSFLTPNHQLVLLNFLVAYAAADLCSSQPDHEVLPHDSPYVHSTEELLSPISPFTAHAGDDYSQPSVSPAISPSVPPSSVTPSVSVQPSVPPSVSPSIPPSTQPSVPPSVSPSIPPSTQPCVPPSVSPSIPPSTQPSVPPSVSPSTQPSVPSSVPSSIPPSVLSFVPPSLPPSVQLSVPPFVPPSVLSSGPP